jgi:hypothetical protein
MIDRNRQEYKLKQVYTDNPTDLAAFVGVCGTLDPADIDPRGISGVPKGTSGSLEASSAAPCITT